jgi:thioester reductase-like protein
MARPGFDDVVLLTGFPSFYAHKQLEVLLGSAPRTFVYLVVLERLLPRAEAALESLPQDQRERVALLLGDAAAMDLGLSGAEFRQLTREVDRIHHAAHLSHFGADLSKARALHVQGAREIVELGRACADLRSLVHHSTASVSGDRRGTVYEDELEAGQSFHNVLEQTRYEAERVLRRASKELPIVVVRPTMIVGDSGTGEVSRLDGPYLLALLILSAPGDLAVPLPARGDAALHMVPIDYVVRAAQALGRNPAALGGTFHLTDPHPSSAREVFELLARLAGRKSARGYVPANLSQALMRIPGVERFLRTPRTLVEQLALDVRYDTRSADRLLAGSGLTCPPFESYAEAFLATVQARLSERRERKERRESLVPPPVTDRS